MFWLLPSYGDSIFRIFSEFESNTTIIITKNVYMNDDGVQRASRLYLINIALNEKNLDSLLNSNVAYTLEY